MACRCISTAISSPELEALSRRYAAAVDHRDSAALIEVFTPDATMRIHRPGREPALLTGHSELAGIITIVARFPRTVHLVAQSLHVIEGKTASGEVYCTANHFSEKQGAWRNHVMYIRYLDRYLLGGDGAWRISHRTVAIDATEDRPVSITEGGA
ncbi:nuclear transport factor 2 family protein [Mycobacterium ulcerans]